MINNTDNMEMPCLCNCGNWFDLHNGYGSIERPSIVICETCYNKENRQKEFKDELLGAICEDNFRTLSWNQPYASLMLHGKIETRRRQTNVRGKVLICSCAKGYSHKIIDSISGQDARYRIYSILNTEPSLFNLPKGKAIAVADLVNCRPMTKADEEKCFVEYKEPLFIPNGKLWCWVFDKVQAIEPFEVKGKQGWGFVTIDILNEIKLKQD